MERPSENPVRPPEPARVPEPWPPPDEADRPSPDQEDDEQEREDVVETLRRRRCRSRARLPIETIPTAWPSSTTGGALAYSTRPSRTQPLWPPSPMAFESATSMSASRASFGT